VTVDGRGPYGEPTQTAAAIECFLEDLNDVDSESASFHVGLDRLSARETEVLHLLVVGRSNPQIAAELTISSSTVAKHVMSIYKKTKTANRVEVTAYAHRHHLI
jgi:DNA-binding NarL/FixJ family response regulator